MCLHDAPPGLPVQLEMDALARLEPPGIADDVDDVTVHLAGGQHLLIVHHAAVAPLAASFGIEYRPVEDDAIGGDADHVGIQAPQIGFIVIDSCSSSFHHHVQVNNAISSPASGEESVYFSPAILATGSLRCFLIA